MNIQEFFNREAISKLPRIEKIISEASEFSANQMKCWTLKKMYECPVCIDKMTKKQIEQFQDGLIESFKYFEWV